MEPQIHDAAAKRRAVRSAWYGSMAALFIYLLLPWFISGREITTGEPYRGVRVIFWLVAAIQVGVLFWWTRRFVGKEAVLNAVRGTALDPLTYYMGRKIAAIGIAQSVAVYGLVLALVGRYFTDQYMLTALSVALLIRHYPASETFDELERGAGNSGVD
jgi:hypothetical protein